MVSTLIKNFYFAVPKQDEPYPTTQWKRHNLKMQLKKRSSATSDGELKRPEQIVRERMRLETIKNRERVNKQIKDSNRKRSAKKQKKK